jgi:hypothetical protein
MQRAIAFAVSIFVILLLPATVWSADHPVDGRKLLIKAKNGKQKLVVKSVDSSVGFPAIGGSDDPSVTGTSIELFSGSGESAVLTLLSTGWSSKPGSHRFDNKEAPQGISQVRKVRLKEARSLTIASRGAGVLPTGSLGSIALRVTSGTVRTCMLFDAATLVREDTSKFIGKNARAGSLVDCSDVSLGASCHFNSITLDCVGGCSGAGVCALTDPFSSTCSCVDPSSACDGTAPVCNGTCAAGEFCASYGGGVSTGCGCIPDGEPVCGGVPGICGGSCPSGQECATAFDLPVFGGGPFCTCGGTGDCGSGGLNCPPGFGCGGVSGGGPFCVPIECPGSTGFPTCGGNCGTGAICTPVDVLGFQTCVCSPEATACDATCEGYGCGPGQACMLDGVNCICGTP